jgi:hypothetical protein
MVATEAIHAPDFTIHPTNLTALLQLKPAKAELAVSAVMAILAASNVPVAAIYQGVSG